MFLMLCSYTLTTNASSISLESTQSFYPSQWIVESRPISISVSNFDEKNNSKYFSLTLPEDANIRFSEDFSSIKYSWTALNKVWTGITIMPNLRELKFSLKESFVNWDNLNITWIKLKIYSKTQWDRYIWIDLNSDGISEAISANWYRVLDINSYSDTMWPSEVFNLTGTLVDNKLTLSAIMPWDLDFQAIVLENLDKDWKVLSSFFRYNLDNFTYDIQASYHSIRIKTVDVRANYSTWFVLTLDTFKKSDGINNNDSIQNTSTGTTNIGTSSWVLEDKNDVSEPEVVVDTVDKYSPVFIYQERLLNKVAAFIENYINTHPLKSDTKTNESSVIIIRNKLMIELELLDSASKTEKVWIVNNIRSYFKELSLELKK